MFSVHSAVCLRPACKASRGKGTHASLTATEPRKDFPAPALHGGASARGACLSARSAVRLASTVRGRRPLRIFAKKTQPREAYEALTSAKVKSISPKEASKLMNSGWILLDVRPDDQFEESRAAQSVNAPLYQPIRGNAPRQIIRRALYQSMDVKPVEENEGFLEAAEACTRGAKGLIFTCAEGGSLEATFPSFPYGKPSRSLDALYRVLQSGTMTSKNVVHLAGGLNGWFRADLPGEGPEEWRFDARTPAEAKPAEVSLQYTAKGRQAKKERITPPPSKSGTLMERGGNALDPFGAWEMLGKALKEKK